MKKNYLVVGLLVVAAMFFSMAGTGQADDTMVTGFADIVYTVLDKPVEPAAGGTVTTERQFTAQGEVDIEKKTEDVTFRMDLDFASTGLEATGITLGSSTGASVGLEQAKFTWMLPMMGDFGLSLTGGAFNSPIGFEAQDPIDMLQVSHGQLFNLVPSNFLGAMLSGAMGPATLDLIYANEYLTSTAGTGEENSLAALLTISPMEALSFSAGVIHPTAGTAVTGVDQTILDLVASTSIIPNLLLAVEYVQMRNLDAMGITGHYTHGPHALTVRYDMVDQDGTSGLVTGGQVAGDDPYTITVAGSVGITDYLSSVLEWRYSEQDNPTGNPLFTPAATAQGEGNQVFWEWIATF
jgi:hypothetical protein